MEVERLRADLSALVEGEGEGSLVRRCKVGRNLARNIAMPVNLACLTHTCSQLSTRTSLLAKLIPAFGASATPGSNIPRRRMLNCHESLMVVIYRCKTRQP